VGHVLANALSFAVLFTYISGSPFVLQSLYGLSAQQYSLVFAVNSFGLVAAAAANGALVGSFGARFLLRVGVTGSAVASVSLLVFAVAGTGLGPILAALFVAISMVGLVLPNAPTLVLQGRGSHAGAAAALLGCGQFLFGGLAAPLVGLTGAHSAVPMAAVMAVLALAALTALITLIPGTTADLRIGTAGTAGTSGDQPRQEVHHDHSNRH
jgi:DHA1 family bicyclomycin/chloramphenicol resistance-like MFS transporter